MKKRTINAFTLVEMLIVIVIIGILIAALLPRMQAAQGRARDVSRKTAMSQIQSAIVTHQGDHGSWPWTEDGLDTEDGINQAISTEDIRTILINAGMSDVPKDPLNDNTVDGLGTTSTTGGSFSYMVSKRNGSKNAGFVLMARTEVAGGSNRVNCASTTSTDNEVVDGNIGAGSDLSQVKPCQTVEKAGDGEDCTNSNDGGTCKYTQEDQLRYIVLY